jgi:hypothetical protein
LQFHNGDHGRAGSVLAHYHSESTGLIVLRPTLAGPTLANPQYQLDLFGRHITEGNPHCVEHALSLGEVFIEPPQALQIIGGNDRRDRANLKPPRDKLVSRHQPESNCHGSDRSPSCSP